MALKIGVVMDPISDIAYKKDSTLAMLWAATDRGWSLHYMEQKDLYLRDGVCMASSRPLKVFTDPNNYYELGAVNVGPAADLDVILMRKDPPFDNEFLYTTYLLEMAERAGCLVVNRPSSLRDCNEKLFACQFPDLCPPTLVSRDPERLRAFHQEHGDVIMKPLDGMGGSSIFRLRADDPNVGVILETLTQFGQITTMAQTYLPEIADGDKRILLIDGEPVDYCLARIPKKGETRGNLAAGGTGRPQPLSDSDRAIAAAVAPVAKALGLLIVGLDVIGDKLTEINVTSPTCLREIDAEFDTDIGAMLMDAIARHIEQRVS